MSLLQQYVEGLRDGDAEKLAAVFSADALFNDEAPSAMGMDAIVLNGADAIRENFSGLLANGGMNIQNVCICGPAMRYDIVLSPDFSIRALGVATEKDGKIVEYQVRAAS